MATLMLVNPRKRRKASRRKAKTRTRSRRSYARRANPRRARRSVRRHARRSNPIRRMKRTHARRRTRSYRRRRNPIALGSMRKFIPSGVVPQLMGAGKGAAGAIVNDAAMTFIPLPAFLRTGIIGQFSRVAMAFLTGALAGKLVGKQTGADMTRGALTVQLYALAKPLVSQFVPLADASDMGYYNPGTVLGYYPQGQLGAVSPWQSYDANHEDGDAFAGMGDSTIGYYPGA